MATVEEIARRIAAEGTTPPAPWLTADQRESTSPIPKVKNKSWLPNRKVVAGVVSGIISWAALKYFGIVDLDPELKNGITVLVMGLISYLVPLKDS